MQKPSQKLTFSLVSKPTAPTRDPYDTYDPYDDRRYRGYWGWGWGWPWGYPFFTFLLAFLCFDLLAGLIALVWLLLLPSGDVSPPPPA